MTEEEEKKVRTFLLKTFPNDRYMGCPIDKKFWYALHDYAKEKDARIKDLEALITEINITCSDIVMPTEQVINRMADKTKAMLENSKP